MNRLLTVVMAAAVALAGIFTLRTASHQTVMREAAHQRDMAAIDARAGSPAGPTVDGAVQGQVVGTYLHGPVLSRNADLADLLLRWAVGRPLEPLGSTTSDALREQRIREDRRDPTGWGGRDYYTTRRRRS